MSESTKLGHYAFIVGVFIATLAGLFPDAISDGSTAIMLVILGLLVGLLNITVRETTPFLVAALALMVAGGAGLSVIVWAGLGKYLTSILANIKIFVAPASIVVALKAIYSLAQE